MKQGTLVMSILAGALFLALFLMIDRLGTDEPERKDIVSEKEFMWRGDQVKRKGYLIDLNPWGVCGERVVRGVYYPYPSVYCRGEFGTTIANIPPDSMDTVYKAMIREVDSLAYAKGLIDERRWGE